MAKSWAEVDANVLLKYGREMTSKSMELNWWNKFMNNDEGAVIMTDLRDETPTEEGGTVRVYFREDIEGEGIFNNQDLADNLGKQRTMYQDVDYGIFGIGLKSKAKKLESKMATENFRTKTHKDLPKWLGKRADRIITARLTANPTNIVACSAANGVYSENGTIKIKSGDVFTTAAIDEAKNRAINGFDGDGNEHPALEPVMIKTVNKEGFVDYLEYFIMVIGQYAAKQLRSDPVWIENQKMAQNRGDDNPIFTGAMGTHNGVIIFERSNWSAQKSGIITSKLVKYEVEVKGEKITYASGFDTLAGENGVEVELNLFLGATAGLHPFDEGYDYYEDPLEGGRKLLIGADRGLGFNKTKWTSKKDADKNSPYYDKDFGVIVVANIVE